MFFLNFFYSFLSIFTHFMSIIRFFVAHFLAPNCQKKSFDGAKINPLLECVVYSHGGQVKQNTYFLGFKKIPLQ